MPSAWATTNTRTKKKIINCILYALKCSKLRGSLPCAENRGKIVCFKLSRGGKSALRKSSVLRDVTRLRAGVANGHERKRAAKDEDSTPDKEIPSTSCFQETDSLLSFCSFLCLIRVSWMICFADFMALVSSILFTAWLQCASHCSYTWTLWHISSVPWKLWRISCHTLPYLGTLFSNCPGGLLHCDQTKVLSPSHSGHWPRANNPSFFNHALILFKK